VTGGAAPVRSAPALPATFVYVSSAEGGDIGCYRMLYSGELQPVARTKVAGMVMPMAVSPDRRFLYAVSRVKPYSVHAYSIDPRSGALAPLSISPLADSFPYISLDRTGRFLFGASYAGNVISVNAVGADGRVDSAPLQIIPLGHNPHAIRVDESNRFVYVPALGSDAIFQFTFDAGTGRLASNTPPLCLTSARSGPRHFVTSGDNRFLYLLNEMAGTVTTFSVDAVSGHLRMVSEAFGLPPETYLVPGAPRGVPAAPGVAPRNTDGDIWCADIHMTPNGRFLYISERTSSTINGFGVDSAVGKLTHLSCTPTERQPRGFAIDPGGRFLVAAGEKSDTISVYGIDAASGALQLLERYPAGRGSNWVEIVSFD
jgi:6-phosphogluconolactonase